MKPYLHHRGNISHFHWNLDVSVGKHAENSSPCDVSYIQWYYTLAAAHPLTPEDRKAIYKKVSVTGFCLGTDGDPLVAAIYAHQQALSHPRVDGKISVAHGTGMVGTNAFFILRLNSRFAHMHQNIWPRVDLIPGCPLLVAQAVRTAIPLP
jgi:hypothetical protein